MARDEGHNRVHEEAEHWSAMTPLDVWHQAREVQSRRVEGRGAHSTRPFVDFKEQRHKDLGLFHLWAPSRETTRVDVRLTAVCNWDQNGNEKVILLQKHIDS